MPGYLQAMRIPLLRGRLLDEHDIARRDRVVVISNSLATLRFGNADPLGHTLKHAGTDESFTIVGVVGDVKQQSLTTSQAAGFYVPLEQWPWTDELQTLVVRTKGDPAALSHSLRTAIWSVNKDQPVVKVATMASLVQASEARRRFALMMFNAFAGMALVLAGIGIYGVLSRSVEERMREMGVRIAFGASRHDLLAAIARQSGYLIVFGASLGLVVAVATMHVISALVFNISRFDPASYVLSAVVLVAVAAVACVVPAIRAATVDPAVVLRAE
jgi:ABC-type antimicrobial peptide transport system permease subunit